MGWSPGSAPTSGNDQYVGIAGNDGSSGNPVHGLGGDDALSGLAGNDVLAGDTGDDILFGGVGNDMLDGGDGNDRITDEDGADKIWGGGGDDVIIHDETVGQPFKYDNFDIYGGDGNDLVHVDWRFFDSTDSHLEGGSGIDALELEDSVTNGKNLSQMDQTGFEILYTGGRPIEVYASTLEAFDTIRYSATDSSTRPVFELFQKGDLNLADELGSQSVQISDQDDYISGRIITTGAGNDIIYAGRDPDIIYAGQGNDKLASYGGAAGQLFGEEGNDELSGLSIQYGGAGNDSLRFGKLLYGGDDGDFLYAYGDSSGAVYDGGQGIDTLVFSPLHSTNYTVDLRGASLNLFEKVSFGESDGAALVAVALIYASQIGSGIWSNASIEGYKDSTLQITMGGLTATDLSGFTNGGGAPKITVTGDGDAETINGSIFADTIYGGGGADILTGGRGVDALYGGDGDDQVTSNGLDNNAIGETYDGGAGADVLIGAGPNFIVNFSDDTVINFEELRFTNPGPLGTGTIKVTADQVMNIHVVTGVGLASTGDVLQVVMGARTSINLSPGAGMTITNFAGSSDHIVINGDGENESLIGSVYKDTIYGGAGSDFIDGGAGLDSIYGGDGNDTIHANAGDVVAGEVFDGGAGTDTLIIDTPFNDGFNIDLGLDTLKSIDQLIFAFTDPGEFSFIHLLASQIGPGLSSTATIWGDQQDDTTEVLVFAMGAQKTLDLSGLVFQGFGGGDYVLINGDGDGETITGSAVADAIIGGGGADRLNGGLGADYLAGGAGNDTYVVDAADVVMEAAGEGVDTVQAGFSYTLGDNLENLTLTGTGDLAGMGNGMKNKIIGNSGNDGLYGLGDADSIDGKAGNDLIDGGTGKDKLTGGTGQDLFVFSVAPGAANADTITDFKPVDDTIGLSALVFGALGASIDVGELKTGTTAATIKATDANDFLLYNKATGELYYDADANGAGAAQLIATLTGKPVLTEADFHVM